MDIAPERAHHDFSAEVLEQLRRQRADNRPGRLIRNREDLFDLCREIGLTEQEISNLDAQAKQRAASRTTTER